MYPLSPEPPVSVTAFQLTLIWLQLMAEAVSPVGEGGGVVSGHAGVFVLAVALIPDTLPALSTAVSAYEYTVDADMPGSLVEVAGAGTCFTKTPFR